MCVICHFQLLRENISKLGMKSVKNRLLRFLLVFFFELQWSRREFHASYSMHLSCTILCITQALKDNLTSPCEFFTTMYLLLSIISSVRPWWGWALLAPEPILTHNTWSTEQFVMNISFTEKHTRLHTGSVVSGRSIMIGLFSLIFPDKVWVRDFLMILAITQKNPTWVQYIICR